MFNDHLPGRCMMFLHDPGPRVSYSGDHAGAVRHYGDHVGRVSCHQPSGVSPGAGPRVGSSPVTLF